jgi:hypothetical protein
MIDANYLMLWQADRARSIDALCRQRRNLNYLDPSQRSVGAGRAGDPRVSGSCPRRDRGTVPMMADRGWWQLTGGEHYRELATGLRELTCL